MAVEISGGQFINGRHNRGAAMIGEYEKDREAVKKGWRLLKYLGSDLKSRPVQVVEEVEWLLSVV